MMPSLSHDLGFVTSAFYGANGVPWKDAPKRELTEADFSLLDAVEPLGRRSNIDSGPIAPQFGGPMSLSLEVTQEQSLDQLLAMHPELRLEQVRNLLTQVQDVVERFAKLPAEGKRLVRQAIAVEDLHGETTPAEDVSTPEAARRLDRKLKRRERDRERRAVKKRPRMAP